MIIVITHRIYSYIYIYEYIVFTSYVGTSGPIGELNINIWKMTLKQLRPIIQYNKSDHMDRRSLIFQVGDFIWCYGV